MYVVSALTCWYAYLHFYLFLTCLPACRFTQKQSFLLCYIRACFTVSMITHIITSLRAYIRICLLTSILTVHSLVTCKYPHMRMYSTNVIERILYVHAIPDVCIGYTCACAFLPAYSVTCILVYKSKSLRARMLTFIHAYVQHFAYITSYVITCIQAVHIYRGEQALIIYI